MSSSERAEITSLEEILLLGIIELEGVEGGGIAPESSKVELESKVLAKSSALEEGKTAVVPSDDIKGGKEEEVKLELTFLQNARKGERKRIQKDYCIFFGEKSFWYLEE